MDTIRKQIDELCEHLNEAINAYYNEHREIMTNKEFDDAMQYLSQLEKIESYHPSNSPVGRVGATVSSSGRADVIHEIRARSLDKTKDPKDVLSKLSGAPDDLTLCMWKLDGCTVVLTYIDGDLVLAATRGDGEKGKNITSNTKYITGIPQHINMNPGKIIIRGECVISYADFEEINANLPEEVECYANPRNLASASVSMLDPEDMKNRRLHFKAFDFTLVKGEPTFDTIFDSWTCMTTQFNYLAENGFEIVTHTLFHLSDIEDMIAGYTAKVKDYEYPVDGLVFALDNRRYSEGLLGTQHHPDPKYGYAFKWADEEVETTLRQIEWSPSRTGLCNPVAIFDPVQIAGTTVSRASLHNITQMHRILGPHPFVGEKILVMKANMVIPIVTKGFWEDVYSRGT